MIKKTITLLIVFFSTAIFAGRYYDADIGLWVSIDPAGQFFSPYSYTGNGFNPLSGFDPNGEDFISITAYNTVNPNTGISQRIGLVEYFAGTIDAPGKRMGYWLGGSGGNGTPLSEGTFYIKSELLDVSSAGPGWLKWGAPLLKSQNETDYIYGAGDSRLWFHDDIDLMTSGCQNWCVSENSPSSGNMQTLIKNSKDEFIPIVNKTENQNVVKDKIKDVTK